MTQTSTSGALMKNCRRVYEYRIGGVTSDVEATSATNTWAVLPKHYLTRIPTLSAIKTRKTETEPLVTQPVQALNER